MLEFIRKSITLELTATVLLTCLSTLYVDTEWLQNRMCRQSIFEELLHKTRKI